MFLGSNHPTTNDIKDISKRMISWLIRNDETVSRTDFYSSSSFMKKRNGTRKENPPPPFSRKADKDVLLFPGRRGRIKILRDKKNVGRMVILVFSFSEFTFSSTRVEQGPDGFPWRRERPAIKEIPVDGIGMFRHRTTSGSAISNIRDR